MTEPKKAKGAISRRRYIPLKEKPINWQKENKLDTRVKQDNKFQRHMIRLGFSLYTSRETTTSIARSANIYSEGSCSSPQGWET